MHRYAIALLFITVSLHATPSIAQQRRKSTPKTSTTTNTNRTSDIAALEQRVNYLSRRVWELEQKLKQYEAAELDTTGGAFVRVDSNNASFLVRVARVEPYLNGYKVVFGIGNITTASFTGFDVVATWGIKEPNALQNFDGWMAWKNSLREKVQAFAEVLSPGKWNEVEMILTPAKADELAYLKFSMITKDVSLHK
jgi:hypothetical protein